jgi:uncharacterized protein (DUF983 family)
VVPQRELLQGQAAKLTSLEVPTVTLGLVQVVLLLLLVGVLLLAQAAQAALFLSQVVWVELQVREALQVLLGVLAEPPVQAVRSTSQAAHRLVRTVVPALF